MINMIPPIASLAGFQIKKMFRIIGAIFSFVVIITLIFNLFFLISSPETNKRRIQAEQDTKKMREEMNRLVYSNQEDLDEDQKIVAGMYSSIMCNMTGDLCEPNQKVRYKENTVASKISDMVAIPFRNPPASGVYWVRDTLENASFIPKTYAQGMGFASLTSFQTIWKAMRDITFLGLVIIIVVIGFIVMFNVPVGGKSSVTIEAMLPRLVITLLFISFSYAIAGFLIDLMNIAMVLVVALFAPLTQGSQSDYLNSALSGQPYNMFYLTWWAPIANGDIWDASRALYDLIPSGIRYSIDSIVYYGLGHILLLSATAGLAN